MLRIALCDDEPEQCDQTGALLRQYLSERPGLAAELTLFYSGAELLRRVKTGGGFDLYVLDIIMPALSGIDLGVQLRELGRDEPIIYLTTSPDYAVDSYLAQAFYYLLKPVEPERLYAVLDQAAALLEKRRGASIPVKTKTGVRRLPLDDILYVELVGRAARYHLLTANDVDSVTFHGAFQSEMTPLLEDPRFVMCSSSFAVNLHYVTAVDKGSLTLNGEMQVPLSRGLAAGVKKQWGDYWLGGDGIC